MRRFCIFLLVFTFNIYAVEPSVRFEQLSIDDGLSQVTINDVMQDKQGFLWMATQDGLNRYDGYNFKVFINNPNDPTSISSNYTRVVFQDSKERIWIGSNDSGFSRFNPQSETFTNYTFPPTTPKPIDALNIKAIVEDCQGYLWIGTYKGGLHRFDSQKEQFQHFMHTKDKPNSLAHNRIWSLTIDKYCNLWAATSDGVDKLVIKADLTPDNAVFIHHKHDKANPNGLDHERTYSLLADSQGFLWVGTRDGLSRTRLSENLDQYANTPHRFSQFSLSGAHTKAFKKNHADRRNFIWSLFEDSGGRIWIGSRGSGLYRFDPDSNKLYYYQHLGGDRYSLSNNIVLSMIEDQQGQLWVGTFAGGLNKLNLQSLHFNHYRHDPSIVGSVGSKNVRAMLIDKNNTLWVATDNGLNRFDNETQTFKVYNHNPDDQRSLSAPILTDIFIDTQQRLWIGTLSSGLNRYNPTSDDFTRYEFNTSINKSLYGSMARSFFEDSQNNLWIMTNEALNLFDHQTQQFTPYVYSSEGSEESEDNEGSEGDNSQFTLTDAISMFEDQDGIFWIGTDGQGIVLFNPQTGRFSSAKERTGGQDLALERVYVLHKSNNNILWIASNKGLGKFNFDTKQFTLYQTKDGLPNNTVMGLLEDEQGHLWLSTNKGLSWFNPNTENFINFTSKDGLQSNEFNSRAFYRSKKGELFFGGIDGFNRFYPVNIKQDTNPPNIVLTDFLVTNQSVAIKPHASFDKHNFALPQSIETLDEIIISHQQNLVSVEFAGLHFVAPSQNRYAYKLEGQDPQWIYTDSKNRRATYTNLPSGQYKLRVKASNHQQFWQERKTPLTITVLTPPWRTWWAYSLYFVIITLAITTIITLHMRKQTRELAAQRQKTQDEQALNQKLKLVDKLKDQFLANTSHELRTPLNGIVGLAESLIDGATGPLARTTKMNLSMIATSGRRLSNLINDILDFSKLKNHSIELKQQSVDLYSLIEVIFALSKPLLGDKNLSLVNNIDKDLTPAWADENRLEQMFHNLIGNSIKFTEQGSITVSAQQQCQQLVITVSDTGIGIEADQFDVIFKSFTQLEEHTIRNYSGTGLGLSVTKQLIELHGGSIDVTSTVGKGTTFSLTLPISEQFAHNEGHRKDNRIDKGLNQQQTITRLNGIDEKDMTDSNSSALPQPDNSISNRAINTKNFSILLVDDDPINRQVISNVLTLQHYRLTEASSGAQALEYLQHRPFDLVLLDIMMPKISGFEVCKQLRQQYSVSELPVIFLTAKNQVNDLVESFNIGANDYLSKPIAKNELLARVEIHLTMLDINKNLEDKVKQRTQELQHSLEQLKATQKQLIEAEKMASLGALVAGVAHEVNTPLGICITMATVQLEKVKNFESLMVEGKLTRTAMNSYITETKQAQHLVEQHLNRCSTLVQEFKEVAVEQSNNHTSTINFQQYLNQVVDSLVKKSPNNAVTLTLTSQDDWSQVTYPGVWWQIIERLFDNSHCHAFSQQITGEITIEAKLFEDTIVLTYCDNGKGMNQEQLNKIYEPFYTTGRNNGVAIGNHGGTIRSHGGTGLGMHIVFNLVVHKLKGEIDCHSEPNQGVEFVIKVPIDHT